MNIKFLLLTFSSLIILAGCAPKQQDVSSILEVEENQKETVVEEVEQTITFQLFFANTQEDPDTLFCEKTYPTTRSAAMTISAGRLVLEELLMGPTEEEKSQGFITVLNENIFVNSLSIDNGIARADFSEELDFQVGGSCRIATITSQITETLKQFAFIDEVEISINGRTEEILQP